MVPTIFINCCTYGSIYFWEVIRNVTWAWVIHCLVVFIIPMRKKHFECHSLRLILVIHCSCIFIVHLQYWCWVKNRVCTVLWMWTAASICCTHDGNPRFLMFFALPFTWDPFTVQKFVPVLNVEQKMCFVQHLEGNSGLYNVKHVCTVEQICCWPLGDPVSSVDLTINFWHEIADGTFLYIILIIVFDPQVSAMIKIELNLITLYDKKITHVIQASKYCKESLMNW